MQSKIRFLSQLPLQRNKGRMHQPLASGFRYHNLARLFVALALAVLAACSSPREAFDKQNYSKAFRTALASLKKDKGDKETLHILQQSLKGIMKTQWPESRRLATGAGPEAWEQALVLNYELQEMARVAHDFLPAAFEKELGALQQEAGELELRLYNLYFEQGRTLLARAESTGLKDYAQQANGDFNRARRYAEAAPAILDSLSKLSFRKGVVYYHVEADAPFNLFYNHKIDQVFKDVEDYSGGFLVVIYESQASSIDCAIEIRFSSLDIEMNEERGDEDFNREVVVSYETATDSSGAETQAPVYGSVEGNVAIITRTKTASWEAEVEITPLTANCKLSSESFQAEASSVIREVKISGDERAIPEEYLHAQEEQFMDEEDMVEQLLEDLFDQIVRYYF